MKYRDTNKKKRTLTSSLHQFLKYRRYPHSKKKKKKQKIHDFFGPLGGPVGLDS